MNALLPLLGLLLVPISLPAAQGIRLAEDRAVFDWDDGNNRALLLGDLDGDRVLDAVVLNSDDDSAVMLGRGDGRFERTPAQLDPDVLAGELLDADGNGTLDLLIGRAGFGAQLLLGDGAGSLTKVPAGLPQGETVADLATADADGDGDLDVLLADVGLYLWAGSAYAASGQAAMERDAGVVRFGDIDGDGDPDAFFGYKQFASANEVFRNDGGVFGELPGALAFVPDETWGAAFGDVDADGDLDLALGNQFTSKVLRNDGAGIFADVGGLPSALSVRSVLLADLDVDGDLDAFLGTLSNTPERLYANDGGGTFVEVALPFDGFESSVLAASAGDVDGDDDPDLVVGAASDQAQVLIGDGALRYSLRERKVAPAPDTREAVAGDFDLDGDFDVFLVQDNGFRKLLANDGEGNFADVPGAVPGASSVNRITTADFNGDQYLDVLLLPYADPFFSSPVHLLRNDGDSSFTQVTGAAPLIEGNSGHGAFLDADLDGDLDALVNVVVTNYWVNDGAGNFTDAPASWLPGSDPDGPIVAADFDLDGVPETFGISGFFECDGAGVLTKAGPGSNNGRLRVGDFDGDLDLDVAEAGPTAPERVFLYEGSPTFTEVGLPDPLQGLDLAVGDFDEDGRDDVAIATALGIRVYASEAAGGFTEVANPLQGYGDADRSTLLAFDADGDADSDLFVLGSEGFPARLWSSRGRHVALRGFASVGKAAEVQVFGPAGEPCLLAASLAPTAVELPLYGTLKVDPTALLSLESASLGPAGTALFAAPVPDLAVLVGLPVFWQAAAGVDLRLTNLEQAELAVP
ncbi:MAG: VCBS repeat-containing protein [Planctomycetota bacterium]